MKGFGTAEILADLAARRFVERRCHPSRGAIRLQSDALVAYDSGLLAAAVDAGLNVLSPGCPD